MSFWRAITERNGLSEGDAGCSELQYFITETVNVSWAQTHCNYISFFEPYLLAVVSNLQRCLVRIDFPLYMKYSEGPLCQGHCIVVDADVFVLVSSLFCFSFASTI